MIMKNKLLLALVLLSAICYLGCGPSRNRKDSANSTLPSFQMLNYQGTPINLQQFKGRKVMVNLWASWCGPCRTEMPTIEQLQRSIDTSKGVIILLSLDNQPDKARRFLEGSTLANQLYFPDASLPELFNVPGIPTTFFFDEEGRLAHTVEGSTNYDADTYRKLLQ